MTFNGLQSAISGNTAIYSAVVNVNASGNNTVIAGVTGRSIAVLYAKLIAASSVAVTWESSGGTILDGPMTLAANGGYVDPLLQCGHYRTVVGEGLVLNLGGAVQVGGHLLYSLV